MLQPSRSFVRLVLIFVVLHLRAKSARPFICAIQYCALQNPPTISAVSCTSSLESFFVLVCARRRGRYWHLRSVTSLTTRPFGKAGSSWPSLSLSFAADEWDVVCAGAVDVEEQIVDKEESPWSYRDNAE